MVIVSLCCINHQAMRAHVDVKVQLQAFLTH